MDSNKTNHPTSPLVSSNTDQKDREVDIQRDGDGEKQECQNVVVLMKPSVAVADKPLKKRRRSADESPKNMTTVVNLINFSNDDTYRRRRLSQSPQPQSPPQPQLQSLPLQQQTQPQSPPQQRSQPQLQSLPPQQPQTPPQQQTQPQSPPQQQRSQPQLQTLPPHQPQTPSQQTMQPQSPPQQRLQPQLQSLPPQQPQTPLQLQTRLSLQVRSPPRLERLYLQPEQLQPPPEQSKSQLPPLPNFPVQTATELQQSLQTELKSQSQSQLRFSPEPIPENRYKCDIDKCERSFSSFQALGGHKASHRYKEQAASNANANTNANAIDAPMPSTTENSSLVPLPREHKCEICFKTFTSGQALGGHKRCHYQGILNGQKRDNEDSVSGGEGGGIRTNQSVVSELITIGSEKRNTREELCIDLNKSPPAEAEKEEGNGGGGGGGEVGGGDGDDSMSATASERKMRLLIECDEDFISKMDDSVKIMGKYTPP